MLQDKQIDRFLTIIPSFCRIYSMLEKMLVVVWILQGNKLSNIL